MNPASNVRGTLGMNRVRLLKIVLRVVGVTSLFALIAVVMPMAWMAAAHQWFGLGEMPSGIAVDYLARSLSAFYALFGFLCLVLATDVERYRTVVWSMALAVCFLGVMMTGIDVAAGMPVWWIASEGSTVIATGLLLAFLSRNEEPSPSDHSR